MENSVLEIGSSKIRFNLLPNLLYTAMAALVLYLFLASGDYWLGDNANGFYDNLLPVFYWFLIMMALNLVLQLLTPMIRARLGRNVKPDLAEDDRVEALGPANMTMGRLGAPGKLFLTGEHLIFRSYLKKYREKQTSIPYTDIEELIPKKTNWVVDNALLVRTHDGKNYDFMLNERDSWMELLEGKMQVREKR